MASIEKFKVEGVSIKIYHDEDAESPRENDNAGTMVCWHRGYTLGDEQPKETATEYKVALACRYDATLEAHLEKIGFPYQEAEDDRRLSKRVSKVLAANFIIIPLYLMDHSGLSLRAMPFTGTYGYFDSGQVGFTYIDREKMLSEWGVKGGKLTKQIKEMARKCLLAEVEEYHQYLSGQVYGYKVKNKETGAEESCWGFFGLDYCRQEATTTAKELVTEVVAA